MGWRPIAAPSGGGGGGGAQVGGGASVGISSHGWPDAVVWNPWTTMEACYKEFVCVENAAVASPVVVAPGKHWSASMALSAH